MTNKTVKPMSNTTIGALLILAFNDEFNTDKAKVVVTGAGDVRTAVAVVGDTKAQANVRIASDQTVTVVVAEAVLTAREWAKLTRSAEAAARKSHDKVVAEFVGERKKSAKKAAAKQKEADAKAKKAAAERVKADKKKAAEAAKSAKKAAKTAAKPGTTLVKAGKTNVAPIAAKPFPGA